MAPLSRRANRYLENPRPFAFSLVLIVELLSVRKKLTATPWSTRGKLLIPLLRTCFSRRARVVHGLLV